MMSPPLVFSKKAQAPQQKRTRLSCAWHDRGYLLACSNGETALSLLHIHQGSPFTHLKTCSPSFRKETSGWSTTPARCITSCNSSDCANWRALSRTSHSKRTTSSLGSEALRKSCPPREPLAWRVTLCASNADF